MSDRIFYVVVDPVDGCIQRTGTCVSEDAPLQGEFVLVAAEDPGVSSATHRFDAGAKAFVPLQSGS